MSKTLSNIASGLASIVVITICTEILIGRIPEHIKKEFKEGFNEGMKKAKIKKSKLTVVK